MPLAIHNISFERNDSPLFSQLNCVLQPGDLLQVRGRNGSGKSTLLRILAGFLEPHEGDIIWEAVSILKQRGHYQQKMCYIGHQNGIKPYLTVHENLCLNAALMGFQPEQIPSALSQIGLKTKIHTPAFQLSSGQLRRLALTRCLLSRASVWILDEPTASLDAEGQQLLIDLLKNHLHAKGIAIIASHHDLPWTEHQKTIQLAH
ncbi:MAG: hypothetical protein ACD_60C00129G0001 [uncultured bacterium]|nr:MAG: hypothetical protein ACD_60C00129G0001 [uncultured bacterium]